MSCGTVAATSLGTTLETQNLRPGKDVVNQKVHFKKMAGDSCALSSREDGALESIPQPSRQLAHRSSDCPDWSTEGRLRASWLITRRPLLAVFPALLQISILTPYKQRVFNSVYTLELPEKSPLKYYYLDSTPELLNKNVLGKGRGFKKPSRCLMSSQGWQ